MINKVNMKKWVNYLRTTKKKQTRNALNKKNVGFCCLGIACELAIRNGVKLKKELNSNLYSYNESRTLLPKEVREWLGLARWDNDPYLTDSSGQSSSASYYNDHYKYSFKKIADLIEYTFLKEKKL